MATVRLQAADGTLVEVKATGRLQSWATKKLSPPLWTFRSVRASMLWAEELGRYVEIQPENRVHFWVFALHAATGPAAYDPTDLSQWEFRVLAHRQLLASGQVSAKLSFFDRLGIAPVRHAGLRDAVTAARARNDELAAPRPSE